MRKRTKKKLFKISLLIILALSTTSVYNFIGNEEKSDDATELRDEANLKSPRKSGYWSTNFIHIKDDNWSATLFPWIKIGLGTKISPHFIENVTINAGGMGSGILIENSKEYFRIKNCTFYNSGLFADLEIFQIDAGIELVNTSNGLLINDSFSDTRVGIALINDCHNNTILGNKANKNVDYGITLLDNCHNNTIMGNILYNNDVAGVYLSNSNNNTIKNNTVNNSFYGISIQNDCSNNTILGNILNKNYFGVMFSASYNNTFSGNNMTECGVVIWPSVEENSLPFNIGDKNLVNGKTLYYYTNEKGLGKNNFTDSG